MIKSPVRIVVSTCTAALFGAAVGFAATGLQAGVTKESATISVTVQASAGVGLATPPAATPAPTTSTSTSIPTVPISTTSNVGYGSPAPVASSSGPPSIVGSDGGTSVTPGEAARTFASRGALPVSLGGASAVAVGGAPNQTFNVILPGDTSYSDGGRVVNLKNFQHSAGTTPALGKSGFGTFSVGASVSGQTNPQAATSSAFTPRSPLVNIDVTYN